MSNLKAEQLVKQIKLNQNKGLYLVENLSPNFAQSIAEKVGVIAAIKANGNKLEIKAVAPRGDLLNDDAMEQIIGIFSELEPEGECRVVDGDDTYILDLQRGYELVIDEDSFVQQRVPVLADASIINIFGAQS